jgi:hypothetical protein
VYCLLKDEREEILLCHTSNSAIGISFPNKKFCGIMRQLTPDFIIPQWESKYVAGEIIYKCQSICEMMEFMKDNNLTFYLQIWTKTL